jgi:hypothetical protein
VFAEAVIAVDRPVATGLERNCCVLATIRAYHCEHLALASSGATVTVVAPLLTAGWATLGFVGEALFRVVRLVVRAENEWLSAVQAG